MVVIFVLCVSLDCLQNTSFWSHLSYVVLILVMLLVLFKNLIRYENYSFIYNMSIQSIVDMGPFLTIFTLLLVCFSQVFYTIGFAPDDDYNQLIVFQVLILTL
jgi:hypothetical protein